MSAGARPKTERLIVQIAAAINTRALYAQGHPRVAKVVRDLEDSLAAACAESGTDAVTALIVADDLVVDQQPLRKGNLYQQTFVRTLKRRGVERLTLALGLDAAELDPFLSAMAGSVAPASSAHLIVGRVEAAVAGDSKTEAESVREPLTASQLDRAREAFVRFRTDRRGGIGQMEGIVWSLMDALSRSGTEVLPLAPLKDHDEYTFIHSVNVSLLVLSQARSFGLRDETTHSLGMAAMFHDFGKLFVPLSILNKPGTLDGDEWKVMQSHVELGAWHLCGLETVAPLMITVAYEHHLRYDGAPAYPVLKKPRRPSLAAQMTAIADTFDAICTVRPYNRPLSRAAALEIIGNRSGTFHDPFLAGNVVRLLGAPSA
jgi:HD-GYP domain-containing protein (c-di-GMP phosphodiesterase class II)